MSFPLDREAIARMDMQEVIDWSAALQAEYTIRMIHMGAARETERRNRIADKAIRVATGNLPAG